MLSRGARSRPEGERQTGFLAAMGLAAIPSLQVTTPGGGRCKLPIEFMGAEYRFLYNF